MLDKAVNTSLSASFWDRHRSKLLITLVFLQIVVLLGLTASSYAAIWFGQEIRIQTAPIDPRDLLYGDHVRLKYDISQLRLSLWKESASLPERGKAVYVLMKRNTSSSTGFYEAAGVYASKPSAAQDDVVLKGRMGYSYNDIFHVEYSLETYYVSENSGKELEKQAGNMLARVKVAPWGRAVLVGLEPVK